MPVDSFGELGELGDDVSGKVSAGLRSYTFGEFFLSCLLGLSGCLCHAGSPSLLVLRLRHVVQYLVN